MSTSMASDLLTYFCRLACGHDSFEDDYATITKANANRFMSLVKYLSYKNKEPNW